MSRFPRPRPRLVAASLAVIFALLATAAPADAARWAYPAPDRVVAIGDVHGAYEALVSLLREAQLVDRELRWSGGTAHLVMLGDLVDRGARSRDALDLLRRLQREARAAGGAVHVLLGNHEVMNLVGDMRYVSRGEFAAFADEEPKKVRRRAERDWIGRLKDRGVPEDVARRKFEKSFPPGFFAHRKAFSSSGEYGQWLLDQHVLLKLGDTVFVHGGLPPWLAEIPAGQIDHRARAELRELVERQEQLLAAGVIEPWMGLLEQYQAAVEVVDDPAQSLRERLLNESARRLLELQQALVLRADGPLWYRGTSMHPPDEEEDQLEQVLAHLGAGRVVVGHTPTHSGRITSRLDGRVIRADTGMLASHYGGQPGALLIEGGETAALYPGRGRVPVDAPLLALDHRDDAYIEKFLRTARVVADDEIGVGSTRPRQLTLARDEERRHAVFKTHSGPAPTRGRPPADRYQNEVAAYWLDRELGLGLVPPTILRIVDGERGSLQLWIEGAISDRHRRDEGVAPRDPQQFAEQQALLWLLDQLIDNRARGPSNVLVTVADDELHAIDNARSFGLDTCPECIGPPETPLPDEVLDRLAALERGPLLQRMHGVLDERQVDALLARRDALLARLGYEGEPDRAAAAQH
jgi:hypothetical protein